MEAQRDWKWIFKFIYIDFKALCGSRMTTILNVINLIKDMKLIINVSKEGPNRLVEVLTLVSFIPEIPGSKLSPRVKF
jgi:hypothetical protein